MKRQSRKPKRSQKPKRIQPIPPPIDPDSLIVPSLLPYAKKLRDGKPIGFDQKFETPIKWEADELALIHDGIREWLQHGNFDRLAMLLKDDPSRMVHPVIFRQIRHLGKLSRVLEETDSFPDALEVYQTGTRYAARTALHTLFQGLWSAFSPGSSLTVKASKARGQPRQWEPWEMDRLRTEYNQLAEGFDKIRDSHAAATQRKRGESRERFVHRMTEVVHQLHGKTIYGYEGYTDEAGNDTVRSTRLPDPTARALAAQAIPNKGLRRDILFAGILAHCIWGKHTKWKAMKRLIERGRD